MDEEKLNDELANNRDPRPRQMEWLLPIMTAILASTLTSLGSAVVTYISHDQDRKAEFIKAQNNAIFDTFAVHIGEGETQQTTDFRTFVTRMKLASIEDRHTVEGISRSVVTGSDCSSGFDKCLGNILLSINAVRSSLGLVEIPIATLRSFIEGGGLLKRLTGYQKADIQNQEARESANDQALANAFKNLPSQDGATANSTPPSAPAPISPQTDTVPRTYLVFFDWNSARLSDSSRQTIAAAAAVFKNYPGSVLEVQGNTDYSLTEHAALDLSKREADVVTRELESRGVPQSRIDEHAFGYSHLLIPTPPRTREPQNRRVALIIR